MKIPIRSVLWLSGFAAGSAAAAPLSDGELTRVINDVKVLPVEASPFAAEPGARIQGRTAVSTGAKSRAELRFSDNTLTRMGANSIFRMDQTTRTVDLQKGVILLQVPKQLGGATVRTAAVTAAVTGTTVLFEYTADGFIKIIVIEGEVDVSLNKDRSKFRTLKAGDMWITRADDGENLPLPVQVDLARLQRTSKLLNADEFAPLGNARQVRDALGDQGRKKAKGELLDTSFQIQGRGRNVTLLLADREHISKIPDPQPDKAINIPGSTAFDNQSTITTDTDSRSIAYNSIDDGRVQLPGNDFIPGKDDVFGKYMFDEPKAFPGLDEVLAAEQSWLALKGDEIFISGSPSVDSTGGSSNLILGATGDINFTSNPPFDSRFSFGDQWTLDDQTRALVFASLSGSINFDSFNLLGSSQFVEFYSNGPSSDVNITGVESALISLPNGSFESIAGRDIEISRASIEATTINLSAKRNVTVEAGSTLTASMGINLKARQGVKVANSSELRSLSQAGNARVLIDARNGNVELSQNSTIESDVVSLASHRSDVSLLDSTISALEIKARVFDGGGKLLISNAVLGRGTNASDLIRLYGEGSAGVRFVGDTTLQGSRVDIAGPSVTIDPGSQVRLSNPSGTTVYSDSHRYNNGTNGNFTGTGQAAGQPATVNKQPYVQRPKY